MSNLDTVNSVTIIQKHKSRIVMRFDDYSCPELNEKKQW